MAATKRAKINALTPTESTAPATPPSEELPAAGRTVATGIGLKQSELDALRAIAAENDLAVNAIGRFAIRYFIQAYRRGDVALEIIEPPPQKKRLRM